MGGVGKGDCSADVVGVDFDCDVGTDVGDMFIAGSSVDVAAAVDTARVLC